MARKKKLPESIDALGEIKESEMDSVVEAPKEVFVQESKGVEVQTKGKAKPPTRFSKFGGQ